MKQLFTGLCLWCLCQGLALAAPAEVQGLRLWAAPDHTRVVFDISDPLSHKMFSLHNPERLVIDIPNAIAAAGLAIPDKRVGIVKGVRTGKRGKGQLRLVLDLTQAVRPHSFTLKPGGQHGHRLVVDLHDPAVKQQPVAQSSAQGRPAGRKTKQLRDLVIAIDAGHGGEDPGATGRGGTREKDVVLSIARKLAALIEREPGMRPVLTRQGDYYIGLRQRINKARQQNADLFISIHADGFRDRRVQGSSVYVLSRRGASSEMARWLAEKENAADLAGGVSLDDKDQLLAEVLLDLSQTAAIEASVDVAGNMFQELRRLGKTHKKSVQKAGFVVLKSPDIPSVLVETAFITNPTEERKLRDKRHQQALARAMFSGILRYFATHQPPGTHVVAREYTIKRGDTLGHIAQHYQVSLNSLKGYNGLKSNRLRIGQTLRIPPAGI
ncbi:MAG: N-acetylmuramoyl-L-alanine amidase [Gammaproteobacteria bacterium]|nr:MAG: N-acetylmuramoyl-L-alanine amidase [Gammaproteobacteria bacterium]